MSNTTKLPSLPQDTADKLVALKGSNPEDFYALITALRIKGWPLRAIAEPLSVSRTAILDWDRKTDDLADLPDAPELPLPEPPEPKIITKKNLISDEEISRLKELTELASTVRRYTDAKAPSRRAAIELEALLVKYSTAGISKTQLAEYCGVSDSAIKQRLRKYI